MSPLSPCIPPSFTRAQAKDAFKKLVPRARVAYAACAACAGPSISHSRQMRPGPAKPTASPQCARPRARPRARAPRAPASAHAPASAQVRAAASAPFRAQQGVQARGRRLAEALRATAACLRPGNSCFHYTFMRHGIDFVFICVCICFSPSTAGTERHLAHEGAGARGGAAGGGWAPRGAAAAGRAVREAPCGRCAPTSKEDEDPLPPPAARGG